MKLKIEKKYQKDINKFRTIINKHRVREDKLFDAIIKKMKIKTKEENEILWDHIYHDTHWTVELEK